jgi:inner membrane protein
LEPVTHILFGATMGRAGLNRTTALATLTLALSAEAPDIDVFMNLFGKVTGFAQHRGYTHTLIGAPFMAAAVVGFVWLLHRWRLKRGHEPPQPVRWRVLYGLALLGSLSHILLDFTNNYGVRPFMPFSYRWFSWDIIFIFEPVLFAFLVLGLLGPFFTRLISQEIGEERRRGMLPGRAAAITALVLVALLWWFRDYQHRRIVAAMQAAVYPVTQDETEPPVRVGAYPYPWDPFAWSGVVETPRFVGNLPMNSFFAAVDPQELGTYRPKPEETPLSLAAKKSRLGRVYLDWARFPYVEAEQQNDGSVWFKFRDLRFVYPPTFRFFGRRSDDVLVVWVHVSKDGQVLEEVVGRREAD